LESHVLKRPPCGHPEVDEAKQRYLEALSDSSQWPELDKLRPNLVRRAEDAEEASDLSLEKQMTENRIGKEK
jgi:hypothetical protein